MNKYRVLVICLTVVAISVVGLAAGGQDGAGQYQQKSQQDGAMQAGQSRSFAGAKQQDMQLAQSIQQQLSNQAGIQGTESFFVTAKDGDLTLYGWTNSESSKDRLESSVKKMPSVKNFENKVIVKEQGWQPKQDQQIKQEIQQEIDSDQIQLQVQNGKVTLNGTVDSYDKLNDILESAYEKGAKSVDSKLTIYGQAGMDGMMNGAAQMQGQGEGFAGINQRDIQLAEKVHQEMSKSDIQGAKDLFISARNGRVVLLGWTNSEDAKDKLEKAAQNIQGVNEVDNELQVHEQGWERKSDQQLKQDVQSQLYWSWFVDSDQVNVSTQNGSVTLSGTVENWGEMNDVIRNVYEGGAKSVKSNLRISEQTGQRNGMFDGKSIED